MTIQEIFFLLFLTVIFFSFLDDPLHQSGSSKKTEVKHNRHMMNNGKLKQWKFEFSNGYNQILVAIFPKFLASSGFSFDEN